MKIKPIVCYSNQKNISFKAKMSKEVWDGIDFLNFETSQIYGTDSKEYDTLNKQIKNIKTLCPKEKIIVHSDEDKFDLTFYTFALKRFFGKPKILARKQLFKDDLYTLENIGLLVSALENEEQNKKI